jgi:hypothetical protein
MGRMPMTAGTWLLTCALGGSTAEVLGGTSARPAKGSVGEDHASGGRLPEAGRWALERSALVRDDCGVARFRDPAGFIAKEFVVAHLAGDAFSLAVPGEGPGRCTIDAEGRFACGAATSSQAVGRLGVEAEVWIETSFSGSVVQRGRQLSGTTEVMVTCEGSCRLMEAVLDFPCPMVFELDLTFQ